MGRTLVVLCDGTWNSPAIQDPTHVAELDEIASRSDTQLVKYVPGVGATKVGIWLSAKIHKLGAGAFGWGLNSNIWQAYVFLAQNYQPGDKIMIFGFSRGAYTARSLTGMIRKCGFVDLSRFQLLGAQKRKVFRLYRKAGEDNAPDAPHIMAVRAEMSPKFSTSPKDKEHRPDTHLVQVDYLGVWDTVGAMGIPDALLGGIARRWNRRYEFHDTNLSSMVGSARHAVAADERRALFMPALWSNLDADADGDPAKGLNNGDESLDRPYQQLWFAGNHAVVGGSKGPASIAAIPMHWVLKGAERLGLAIKPGYQRVTEDPVADADFTENEKNLPKRLIGARAGPADVKEVHVSAFTRFRAMPSYRPQSLLAAILQFLLAGLPDK